MSRHYEAVLELNAVALLKQLRPMITDEKMLAEIDLLFSLVNSVEGVGGHKVGSVVLITLIENGPSVRAKVVRNRGTSDGKILYDLALAIAGGAEEKFHETCPIRDVDGLYVSKPEEDE